MEKFNSILNNLLENYAPKLVGAILALIIGLWIIRLLTRFFVKIMDKRDVDQTLKPFIKALVSITLKVLLIVSVVSMVGVKMTSFIALLGAVGLAIGMALSGTLQNFAGGVMLLIFKPFKVGDYIEAQGHSGTVNEIQIFNTILKSPDNKTIIIPNGGLSTGSMINYSAEDLRRVDWTFGIGYGDKTEEGRKAIRKLLDADSRILQDPAPFVEVSALADSSVNFAVRAWVKKEDYWGVFFSINEKIYNEFNAVGLNIPFPQMDVHVHNTN